VDLYIHSPIRLRGVVLNYLSTGVTLPFYLYIDSPQIRLRGIVLNYLSTGVTLPFYLYIDSPHTSSWRSA
jgi:hypothetical protein